MEKNDQEKMSKRAPGGRRLITKKKQTHRYREQTSGYPWGGGKGEGK